MIIIVIKRYVSPLPSLLYLLFLLLLENQLKRIKHCNKCEIQNIKDTMDNAVFNGRLNLYHKLSHLVSKFNAINVNVHIRKKHNRQCKC